MKLLFLGGAGNISQPCVELALKFKHEVTVVNRYIHTELPKEVRQFNIDVNSLSENDIITAIKKQDIVIDFLCYNAEQAQHRIKLFNKRCDQYIFISTTAFYDREKMKTPYNEKDVIPSFKWDYAANKFRAEMEFMKEFYLTGFPVTIIRPSHTFNTRIPSIIGNDDWTTTQRILDGKPIVVHGDGNSLWTLTHADDFAWMLNKIFGRTITIGEKFHIIVGSPLTWNQIYKIFGNVLMIPKIDIRYVSAQKIYDTNNYYGNSILHHKQYDDYYNMEKFEKVVRFNCTEEIYFTHNIRKTLMKYLLGKCNKTIDKDANDLMDKLITV